MNHNELVQEICELAIGVNAVEASSALKALGTILRERTTEEAMQIIAHIVREK